MSEPRRAAAPRGLGDAEIDEATASAILIIDLDALISNYRRLAALSAPAECAAVVKADAYGLGMAVVAPALALAGCKTFFVATLGEARDLRALLPEATIYVFDGLFEGTASFYRDHGLRPVLNSPEEIKEWGTFSAVLAPSPPRRHPYR